MPPALDRLQRIGLKLFLADDARFEPRELVPIFHRWIQTRAIEQLLVDVADYAHLHEGPLVVLVAHEGNLALDKGGGRLGLQYFRKQASGDPLAARLVASCRHLFKAAAMLEDDPALKGRIRFRGEELEFTSNDRLLASHSGEAFEALRTVLDPLLKRLYPGAPCVIATNPDQQERLTLTARSPEAVTLADLANRLKS